MNQTVAATATVACALIGPVLAQGQDAGRVFVDGAVFAGLEQRAHTEFKTPISTTDDLSATVAGGSVAVGTFLAPRVSVRLEAAFPGSSDGTFPPGRIGPRQPRSAIAVPSRQGSTPTSRWRPT